MEFNKEFKTRKVFEGPAAKRFARDIRRKHRGEYLDVHYKMGDEAIVRCHHYLKANLKQGRIFLRGGNFTRIQEEVMVPFRRILNEEFVEERVEGWACLGFAFKTDTNEPYFIINGVTNAVKTEYALLRRKHGPAHPIVHRVCKEMLGLDVWWPHAKRPTHPDRRSGWTICEPGLLPGEVKETFTTNPSGAGFQLYNNL